MSKKWRYLKTGDGVRVKVDEADYDDLVCRTWRIRKSQTGKMSVVAIIRDGTKVRMWSLGQYLMKPPKGKQVYPRRFNDALDYRRENLIVCSMKERQRMLPKISPRGSSKYRGVSYIKRIDSWRARIEVNGKSKHLGYFKSERAAADAFNQAALKFFGKNAYQNRVLKKDRRKI